MEAWLIVLLTIAVAFIKLGQGFDFDLKTIFTTKNRPFILKGVFVGFIIIPIVFTLLILWFHPPLSIVLMLVITAVCPAADASKAVEQLGGDIALANSLQFITGTIAVVTIPLLLTLLAVTTHIHLKIPYIGLIRDLFISQFIPIVLGVTLRKYFPAHIWIAPHVVKYASYLMIGCFFVLLIHDYSYFFAFKFKAYAALIIATICAYFLGVAFSGSHYKRQVSLGIESSFRNPGLVYLIGMGNFVPEKVKMAIVPYVFTALFVTVLCTLTLKLSHQLLTTKNNMGLRR